MLSEQLTKFRNNNRQYSSVEIIDAYLEVRSRLIDAWTNSLSPDGEGREMLYLQLRGLDSIINEIVTDWSKV
jgi:hypothetical protein